jgi:hypothetical protein
LEKGHPEAHAPICFVSAKANRQESQEVGGQNTIEISLLDFFSECLIHKVL